MLTYEYFTTNKVLIYLKRWRSFLLAIVLKYLITVVIKRIAFQKFNS